MNIKHYTSTVLALAALCACNRGTAPREQVINVSVVEVAQQTSAFSRDYLGNITSENIHLLLAPASGTVASLNVKVGQSIRKGAPVATIDSPNIRSLNKSSQALLRQARDGYSRAKKVYEGGGMTEIQWMDVQTKLAQAQSAAEISSKSLEDCRLKAPFDCTVSEVYATLGADVTVGARVAMLIDEGHLEAAISIPENEYGNTHVGDKALVTVPALDGRTFQAEISKLGVNSTSITRSYIARLSVFDYPDGLKAGMACKVNLVSDLQSRVIVPSNAVKTDDNGRYVWIADSSNVVVKRMVRTEGLSGKGIAVREGLCAGDRVIVEGISKVSTGMKVNPRIIEVK